MENHNALVERFYQGDRAALAKIITIIESTKETDRECKLEIFGKLKKSLKNPSMRIAISGPPGVGKSTFINSIGQRLLKAGLKLAILPIDPSSMVTHGSILGDRARMGELTSSEHVYIRPSPSKGVLGGVSLYSSDVMRVCEAFGFDVIIIETVGVGQSEALASMLSDHFVLLMQPGAGDQLQAMKKGIIEIADFILVNKADGELLHLAEKTKDSLRALSVSFRHPAFIGMVSAINGDGVDKFLSELLARHKKLSVSGALTTARASKLQEIMYRNFIDALTHRLRNSPAFLLRLDKISKAVARNEGFIIEAVDQLLEDFCKDAL